MNYIRHLAIFFFTLIIVTCCKSQTTSHGNVVPPAKVQSKFDSLYPHAFNMAWVLRQKNENAQVISFDCNCQEGLGHLTITFDTNGNIMSKETRINKQDLPKNATDYITNNYPNEFEYGNITKINNEGGISYRVDLKQVVPDGNATSGYVYILKFKASGEFISVDKR